MSRLWLHLLLPRLWDDHRGYAKVAIKLILIHAVLGVVTLQAGSQGPVYDGVNAVAPHEVWATLHIGIAVLGGVGLYWRFILARVSFLLSLVAFNALGTAMIFTAISLLHQSGELAHWRGWLAVTLAALFIGESMDSWATLLEPPVQAAARP